MKKIPVWKNIVLIFALIVSIIIATLCWFYTGPSAHVDPLKVDVGEASYIEISADKGDNWSSGVEMEIGLNKSIREISGNGLTFYKPDYDVLENEQALTPVITTFQRVTDKTGYYEEEFIIRSDKSQSIYLSDASFVKAQDNGFIDGAIRVAFIQVAEDGTETLKCIWAPNSTVEYDKETNLFTRDGKTEPYYYFQKSTTYVNTSTLVGGATSSYVTVIPTASGSSSNCSNCGSDTANKFMWSCGEHMPQNPVPVLYIDVPDGQATGEAKLKLRVWLEGHDRECVSQLDGQKFSVNFEFDSGRGE